MTEAVDIRVLGQLLLMQSVVASLPDSAVIPFVVEGLADIPGVGVIEFNAVTLGDRAGSQRYALDGHGELIVVIKDAEVFAPYADHLRNFVFMLELILEERRERRDIESHKNQLEQLVTQRTAELSHERDTVSQYLDIAGVMLLALDSAGRITMINKKGRQFLGRPEGALLGVDWFENFLPADERSAVRRVFDTLMSGEAQLVERYENRIINADGQELWLAWNNSLLRNEVGVIVGILSSAEDITERKLAEEGLVESQEKYRALSEAAFEAIFISEKGRCLEQNQSAESMFGYAAEEALGRLGTEWIAPGDRDRVAKNIVSGYEMPYEATGLRKDGSTFPALIRGKEMRFKDRSVRVTSMSDITERKRIEMDLHESEATFRKLFEDSSDPILLIDDTGVFVECNRAALDLLKMSKEQFLLLPPARISPEFQPDGRRSSESAPEMIALAYSKGLHRFDWTCVNAEGGEFIVEVSLMPVAIKGQTMLHTTWRDITERKASADKIEHLAFYDHLTELPNRRLLLDRLEQALSSSGRHNRYGALMLLDMDDFKTLNDTLGHDVGDQFLVEVARRLEASVREGDTVARHGGDEFVVILEDLSEDAVAAMQAEIIAVKILHAVSQPYLLDLTIRDGLKNTRSYHCTSSIGITLFQGNTVSADELMKRADTAMYQAKTAGRNSLRFFDPDMQAVVTARAALDHDLREAIRERQFCLYYQPQVDGTGHRVGAEALVRWQHPRRGVVPPIEFISQAEITGLILPLGAWVLETACAQLVAWEGMPRMSHLKVAVNVSARQFRHVDFVDQVLAIVDRTGADPKKLKLELTESLLLDNVEDIIAKMIALKAKGIGFSLDDFGTGYSSLSYLKRLPLDQLKIDRSFVADVLTNHDDAAIARTIVALAASMDLAVIAEGVETEAQREFLAANGCKVYQGYLFGRPMPADDFLRTSELAGKEA
jgi:diguanylate cyclase (GGDEF)-like protein/PAS domain S-box-containing protein